ncbi:MAG: aminotransferase class I/II-fold pyridoxal phosphate-dependent enzyme [Candidatus Pacebacteria bacterium]|nr:aminotransferase class I/II-fold pyridoxal phosphate-dependent enzyme [Candidatus Paceibacterota bacterium]
MERKSWLPSGGENLFQKIKDQQKKAEEKGIRVRKMSIGQPSGAALLSARKAAASAVSSNEESHHEYQDNGSPGVPNFAERFVQCHIKCDLSKIEEMSFLPTPGTKSMLMMIPLACGSSYKKDLLVGTHTKPGYPTPAIVCNYLGVKNYALKTNIRNQFLFDEKSIKKGTKLLMVNFPHNPTGQIATKEFWEKICAYCEREGIRLFNDGAYAGLAHSKDHCTLADAAIHHPSLEWVEAYTASKTAGNATGWRVGAIVGSSAFVGDIATIKSNLDSGFVAPMAAGIIHAIENDQKGMKKHRKTYEERIGFLIQTLEREGMRIAVVPGAGFFTFWQVPKEAFGITVENGEEFNNLMIKKEGIVGVPFGEFIRYSVTQDVIEMGPAIASAFKRAEVLY